MARSQHCVARRIPIRQNGTRSPQRLLMLLTASLLHLGIGATFHNDSSTQEQVTGGQSTTFVNIPQPNTATIPTSNPLHHSGSVTGGQSTTSVNIAHPKTGTIPTSNPLHHSDLVTGGQSTTFFNIPQPNTVTIPTSNPLRHSYNVSVANTEKIGGVSMAPRVKKKCLPGDVSIVDHVSVRTECQQLLLNLGIGMDQIPQDEMLLVRETFVVGNLSVSVANVSSLISEDLMCKCYAEGLLKVADETCVLSINVNESEKKGGGFESQHFMSENDLIHSILSSTAASNIKALSLRNNNIQNISTNFLKHFAHLEVLDLSQTMLHTLNMTQVHLASLIKLQLSNNKLRLFDSSPCNLTSLYIDNNDISDLSFISKFKNLVILEASHNSITSIPLSVTNLTELKCIHLDHNNIKNIANLGAISLKKVYIISLSHNEIEQVNIDFTKRELKLLFLSNNNISNFNFLGARNLVYLDLCNNRISKIDPTHPFADSSITGLKLCNNFLNDANVVIRMHGLQTLDLSNNNIQNFDIIFRNKKQLRHLYLSNVSLQSLDFVKDLDELEVLEVDYNNINNFTKGLIPKKLTRLGVSNNPLDPLHCPLTENGKEIMGNCDLSFEERNDNIILNISMQNNDVNEKMECVLNYSSGSNSGKKYLNQCYSSARKGTIKSNVLFIVIFILKVLYCDDFDIF